MLVALGPSKVASLALMFSCARTLSHSQLQPLWPQRVSSFKILLHLPLHYSSHLIKQPKMSIKGNQSVQKWDEPRLVRDLLAATVNHLNPSKQDMLQIASKAKAMGGWQFTEGAC